VGHDFDDFRTRFSDDERAFGFLRISVRIAIEEAAVSFISDRLLFLFGHVRSICAEYETKRHDSERR
jgi:hypothetical protein